MERQRYQSFFEGKDTEHRWPHAPNRDYGCSGVDGNQTNCDILIEGLNVNSGHNVTDSFKENDGDKVEAPPPCAKRARLLAPPRSGTSVKLEPDSKELSKTVAESMGLYMDDVRDVDYGYGQQRAHEGHCAPQKLYTGAGPHLEVGLPGSAGSPKLTPPPLSCPTVPNLLKNPVDGSSGVAQGSGSLAPAVCCSPHNSHSSLSSPTSLVSSIASPSCFGTPRTSVGSPIQQALPGPVLSRIQPRLPTTCSPSNTSGVGSPLASPLNVLRSPISSPRSMSSVRSPPSCSANLRSSALSPAHGANGNGGNAHPPLRSSPGAANAAAVSSPPSSSGFPVCSPDSALGLGLVQSDSLSPGERGREFKGFEFPKVESEDGETYSVGLDQTGSVKYIKNEPDPEGRSMCLASEQRRSSATAFSVQIKSEPNHGGACLNLPYDQPQHSVSLFPATETTYLSLRDNIDEYSLSGILGPPVSSLNGNYDPGVFPNAALPKGIKQELNDGCYYHENSGVPASAIVGVNSSGHSFHYQIGAQGMMSFSRHDVKDQTNPLLNLISPVTHQVEAWKPHPDLSQGPLSSRAGGYAGQNYITESASLRHTPIGSSSAKVCLVCGDEASGCHYGVVTCGSCKVFFKRAVEGQHNYLCAGRNDCIIDKIRRKNCPACRVRKCLQAGMNLGARKSKKLGKLKVLSDDGSLQSAKDGQMCLASDKELSAGGALVAGMGGVTPYLSPSICSILELIEPEVVYAGYDNTQPDTTDHLLSSLNQLAGKQMIRAVKWAKVLPGFRGLPIEDQITLIQYSWMCLSSFALSWRSYKHTNGQMLYFAPDLVFNEQRMKQSAMYELCVGMRQVSQEFVRLQLTYEEFLSMKVLLLLSTIPKEGLKNQAAFEEMRVNYIKELRRSVAKATSTSGQTWHRFFQLTKLMDAMHDLVGNLLDFCFYTFRESQALKVEFPEMLVEIISDQIPKVESGLTHTLYFHKQ
ncbi:LOW QUALITY PROTEIN: mineralocorticoid receptor-like [Anguilla anguilla]|uniref:LOW QUALITY PROTEIN: mineralocorticoid receptor-like n=1 Tax=Anguilla anguilla TaxID=7936 RepID=UPI0015B2E401|nr:LOW QUALITY PROTEIN: mineralocorticoid receptor-like [Anguilla anguilla]